MAAQTEDLAADAVYLVKNQYDPGSFHRYWMGGGGSRLALPALFRTEAARRWTQPARANLTAELTLLRRRAASGSGRASSDAAPPPAAGCRSLRAPAAPLSIPDRSPNSRPE